MGGKLETQVHLWPEHTKISCLLAVHVCMFSTALIHKVTGCVSASKVLNSLNGSVIFWASGPLFKS